MTSAIEAYLTVRYGKLLNPFPTEDTLASDFKFVAREMREGRSYNFPVRLGVSHGVTIDDTNTAFATNDAISPTFKEASITGATIMVQEDIPWNDVQATMNGIANGGGQGGAYMNVWDEKTESVMLGAELYRELQLLAGPGNTSTAATNIGVVNAVVSGSTFNAGMTVNLTTSSWRPGLWPKMVNAKVDMYQSDGATLVASGLTVTAPTDDTCRITLTKSGSAAAAVAGYVILPRGGLDVSCFGIEAIAANNTTLFGIDASAYPQWKVASFDVDGSLDRDQILGAMSRLEAHGLKGGGTLYCSGKTMTDLIVETMELQRWTSREDVKVQGASRVEYMTPVGVVVAKTHPYFKQSYAFFNPNQGGGIRVGQTDNTFSNGKDQFPIINLPSNAGMRIRMGSHQAPMLQLPWHCMQFTGIENVYDVTPA